MKYILLTAGIFVMGLLTACGNRVGETMGPNPALAHVQNRMEKDLAGQLIDFVNGADSPADLKDFTTMGEMNGNYDAWFFTHGYNTYTWHVKNRDEPEPHSEEKEIKLSNGILASFTEDEDADEDKKQDKNVDIGEEDLPSLTWRGNQYFYDTSIKKTGLDDEQILTRFAESGIHRQVINKASVMQAVNAFHYPKVPDQVTRIGLGIKNDEDHPTDYLYTLLYMNKDGNNFFTIEIKEHKGLFGTWFSRMHADSEKVQLENNKTAYYYPNIKGGMEGLALTIDDYDYYIEANTSRLKTKDEILSIASSLLHGP